MAAQSSRPYWDSVAAEKRFQHHLRTDWLLSHLAGRDILDCGCGYGRLLAELVERGYQRSVGTDFSGEMLRRGAAVHPSLCLRLVHADACAMPFRTKSFDAVLLFTLLTCVPRDGEQRKLLAEVRRVLRPGGLVYLSDLLLNSDARNVERYQRFAEEFSSYGIFRLPEGVVVRHHSEDWIRSITDGFTRLEYEKFTVTTMNGNQSEAFQYLGRLSDDPTTDGSAENQPWN